MIGDHRARIVKSTEVEEEEEEEEDRRRPAAFSEKSFIGKSTDRYSRKRDAQPACLIVAAGVWVPR